MFFFKLWQELFTSISYCRFHKCSDGYTDICNRFAGNESNCSSSTGKINVNLSDAYGVEIILKKSILHGSAGQYTRVCFKLKIAIS